MKRKFNIHSLIIYLGFVIILMSGVASGNYGGSLGLLSGCLLIYFVLATPGQREIIRDNIMWRVKK